MEKEFQTFVSKYNLLKKRDRLLVAVSGGIDSIVLLHLLSKGGFKFAIAHCNFQLRGNESDADEMFVSALAKKYSCKIFVARFNTSTHAQENGISIQMAARDLRYKFFEEIRTNHKFKYIVTAHHATDNVETILINLLRGTGISGLQGIQQKNKNIIRPLLNFTKDDIEKYCIAEKLKWREDSSNISDDYVRNKLRHRVLPVLKEINPSLEQSFLKHSEILNGVNEIIQRYIINTSNIIFNKTKDGTFVNTETLRLLKLPETIWFEFFKQFDFSADTMRKLYINKMRSGKLFLSNTHCLRINRKDWLITEIKPQPEVNITINKTGTFYFGNFSLIIKKINVDKITLAKIKNNKDKCTAFFCADDLKFPLTIRTFKPGDFFYPIGMKGRKLISDYFTDKKISSYQKEKQLLLLSNKEIVWVIGERVSEKCKVTNHSTDIYKFEFKPNE